MRMLAETHTHTHIHISLQNFMKPYKLLATGIILTERKNKL
jgi:hypothetical protein